MDEVIRVQNLSKTFKEIKAVDDLSFTVNRGEVYGFLGQNGAGKSTTIRMMLSLISPSSGSIKIFGQDLTSERKNILRRIGAIIEKPDLYTYLSAEENLSILGKINSAKIDSKKIEEILKLTGLYDRRSSKVKTFSQGMKQRLGLASALLHDPELIVLDEPANGLDPQGIADIRNLILHLSKDRGKTIFISSHLLSEVEKFADSMLIIDKGKKVAEGNVSDLLNPANTLVQVETSDDSSALRSLQNSSWGKSLIDGDEGIVLKIHRAQIPELSRFLVNEGINIYSLTPQHSLEALFLSLTTSNRHVETYADRTV